MEFFDKNSAGKIWSKKDKEWKVSPLMPIRVKQVNWEFWKIRLNIRFIIKIWVLGKIWLLKFWYIQMSWNFYGWNLHGWNLHGWKVRGNYTWRPTLIQSLYSDSFIFKASYQKEQISCLNRKSCLNQTSYPQ